MTGMLTPEPAFAATAMAALQKNPKPSSKGVWDRFSSVFRKPKIHNLPSRVYYDRFRLLVTHPGGSLVPGRTSDDFAIYLLSQRGIEFDSPKVSGEGRIDFGCFDSLDISKSHKVIRSGWYIISARKWMERKYAPLLFFCGEGSSSFSFPTK